MTATSNSVLADRIKKVRETIAKAANRANRSPDDVTLVAVSKTVDASAVIAAANLGIITFGENRVQEADAKIATIRASADFSPPIGFSWHLIGHLQSNKAKLATHLFSMIESVDSLGLATQLDRFGRQSGESIDVLLEVNVSGEATKNGFSVSETEVVFPQILAFERLNVVGLMTVAPLAEYAEAARPHFCKLRKLRDRLVANYPGSLLPHLSMGMTSDYPVAIEEGATIVRVGRAIFGDRPA